MVELVFLFGMCGLEDFIGPGGLTSCFLRLEWDTRNGLIIDRAAKAQHIAVVIGDLESSQSVTRVVQFSMHRDVSGQELCIQRVGIAREDVSVPAGPFVACRVRLWMDLGRDDLEADHDLVASDEGPEVVVLPVAASFVEELEPQFRLVKL
jgi:hypothetical protein